MSTIDEYVVEAMVNYYILLQIERIQNSALFSLWRTKE